MDRISLSASPRDILGKKVKNLRRDGQIPAHVFGKGLTTEHVSLSLNDFIKAFHQAGETGLVDLRIGEEKIEPVLVKGVQYHPISETPLHVDFYQVNLKEKVTVPVPLVLTGEEIDLVHSGEAILLQTLNEVRVEALPTDLVENIEVETSFLKAIDDAITVGDLKYDKEKLTILAEPEEVVVKLAPAVTEEMQQLLEEEKAEVEAAQAEAEGPAAAKEGEEKAEGEAEEASAGEAEGPAAAAGEGGEEKKEEQ